MPDWTAERIFEAHRNWAGAYAATRQLRSEAAPYADRDRTLGRKLRIGYVSPDFRFHPVGRFFLSLIAHHDKSAVHVTCYAGSVDTDDVTRQIAGYADAWRTTIGMNDDEMCARVIEDRIDILVDLAGHTAHHRLGVFARKPAPVQVSWLGYLNTTGLPAIGYRFSDAVVDPPGRADALSVERLLRLPTGFVCFAPPAQAPAVAQRPECASVVFGIANRASKLNLPMARLWAQIIDAVPDSRLAVQTGQFKDEGLRIHIASMLRGAGLPDERLELLDDPPNYTTYLERFGQFDVMLDPSPYSGVTTTCEALWQGVPVVSFAGDRHAARAGASVLTHAGLTELVADTHEGYVERAIALGRDRPRLAAIRASLRERLRASPLCDQRGFARAVEQAFAAIWKEHLESTAIPGENGRDA
jgi:predicted O-linked N-acetylglucosamine transferase (SPINDLY family)